MAEAGAGSPAGHASGPAVLLAEEPRADPAGDSAEEPGADPTGDKNAADVHYDLAGAPPTFKVRKSRTHPCCRATKMRVRRYIHPTCPNIVAPLLDRGGWGSCTWMVVEALEGSIPTRSRASGSAAPATAKVNSPKERKKEKQGATAVKEC